MRDPSSRLRVRRLGSLGLVALASCTATAEPDLAPDQIAIVNGQAIDTDPAAVALTYNGSEYCSATLISRRTVITAAHCLPPNLDFPPGDLEVFFGARTDGPGQSIKFSASLVHPDWNKNVVPNDIGILALDEDAPVAPARMLNESFPMGAGDDVRVVGFGITQTAGTDNGIKRAGTAQINHVDDTTIFLEPGPSLTCNGDSGGPLFIDQGDGPVYAGIHSRSDCSTVSLNERVDIHVRTFIDPFIEQHEGEVCLADGTCNKSCSQDPDCDGTAVAGGDVTSGCAAGGGAAADWSALLVLAGLWLRRRLL